MPEVGADMPRASLVSNPKAAPEATLDERTATLLVSAYSTSCGRCRRGTRMNATHHTVITEYSSGPGEQSPRGCGARFTSISTNQIGPARQLANLVQRRPDLPAVIPAWMTIPGNATAVEAEAQLQVALAELRAAVDLHNAGPSESLLEAGRASFERAETAANMFDQTIDRLRREAGIPK